MSCLFFFCSVQCNINKNISTINRLLTSARSLSLSLCELLYCRLARLAASDIIFLTHSVTDRARREEARWGGVFVLPVAHDHVERWQPTAPPASRRQLTRRLIFRPPTVAARRALRMRHVARLRQLFAFSFIKTASQAVCIYVCVATLLRDQWKWQVAACAVVLLLFISKCGAINFYVRNAY